jgi:hypothetical protein
MANQMVWLTSASFSRFAVMRICNHLSYWI